LHATLTTPKRLILPCDVNQNW